MKNRFIVLAILGFWAQSLWAQEGTVLQTGEDLLFAIKWGVVKAGYSTLTLPNAETIHGKSYLHIVSEARSSGVVDAIFRVRDRNESWIDAEARSTLKYSKRIREGKYLVDEKVEIDPVAGRFKETSYRIDKNRHEEAQGDVPSNVLDILGSLYHIRVQSLDVGQEFTMDVHSGEKVYPLVVSVKRRETVKVKAGRFDCFVVEPHLKSPGIFVQKGRQ